MKKFMGAICSGLASVLTFVFLSLPAWTIKDTFAGITSGETFNGYQLISGKAGEADLTGLNLGAVSRYKVFAIILLVVAAILAIWAVIMLLNSLNVLKMNDGVITLVNSILLIAIVVASVLALSAVLSINGDIASKYNTTVDKLKDSYETIGTQVGLWLVTGVNAIALVLGLAFGSGKSKSKKK